MGRNVALTYSFLLERLRLYCEKQKFIKFPVEESQAEDDEME